MWFHSGFNPGSITFLMFLNDLQHVTKFLDLVMFADDTNLFYSHSNINELFQNGNKELAKVTNWCFPNKLSIDTGQMYIFFHKQTDWNHIPLKLPNSDFNNTMLKRVKELKFLGVMIDQNLNWQSHIKLVETKISKHFEDLFKGSLHLNQKCLSMIYFSFIYIGI